MILYPYMYIIYIYVYVYCCERQAWACTRAARVRPCARARACAIGRARIRADTCERLPAGVDRGWLGAQAFTSASAFNQNLAAWTVVRVTSLTSAFGSTALSGCNQNKLYAAWGTTLRAAYPAYATAACVAVSSFAPVNIQVSSAATVTIRGLGFSSIDPSPSAYLSGLPCRTTTWTTATQLVCAAPSPVLATGAWRAQSLRPSRGLLTNLGCCRCSTRDVGQGCSNHRVRGLHLRRCATTICMVTICTRVGFFMQRR